MLTRSLPSRQQRWFQWQAMQDAGPPIGEHGMWWDGVDRSHMFEGDQAVLDPEDPHYGDTSPIPRSPWSQLAQTLRLKQVCTEAYGVDVQKEGHSMSRQGRRVVSSVGRTLAATLVKHVDVTLKDPDGPVQQLLPLDPVLRHQVRARPMGLAD
eukprot:762128-Hanusia_phi.AAC.12